MASVRGVCTEQHVPIVFRYPGTEVAPKWETHDSGHDIMWAEDGWAMPVGDVEVSRWVNTYSWMIECASSQAGVPYVEMPDESPEVAWVTLREWHSLVDVCPRAVKVLLAKSWSPSLLDTQLTTKKVTAEWTKVYHGTQRPEEIGVLHLSCAPSNKDEAMAGSDMLGELSYKCGHWFAVGQVLSLEMSVVVTSSPILRKEDWTSADLPRGSGITFTEVVTTVVYTVLGSWCEPSGEMRMNSADLWTRWDACEEVEETADILAVICTWGPDTDGDTSCAVCDNVCCVGADGSTYPQQWDACDSCYLKKHGPAAMNLFHGEWTEEWEVSLESHCVTGEVPVGPDVRLEHASMVHEDVECHTG